MFIHTVHLLATDLQTLSDFYSDVLGLPVQKDNRSDNSLIVTVGRSTLIFHGTIQGIPAANRPIYHFAFNVPENRIQEACDWLQERTPLLRANDEAIFYNPNWNTYAVYFNDPAGNIVEFITRHDLQTELYDLSSNSAPNSDNHAFDTSMLLNVSEIGIMADDVSALATRLAQDFNLPYYGQSSDQFTPMGDENGLLIVVKTGRTWFPTIDLAANASPESVVFSHTPTHAAQTPAVLIQLIPATILSTIR